ncbi:hypothetical protein DYB36_003016 [Aphanomyces astaci]|uniref:WRKY19-like zinc finger domain-containing protein n=1 Tax=Aphanomyces astaci TaxID=112090 RepID=A0A396ZZK2_APHAT|nr:hypothetical protein DYB36_003016 [Aphanomyces astaci]
MAATPVRVLPTAQHVHGWYSNTSNTVGVVKIIRPRVKNCLSMQTYHELSDHLQFFQADADVLAVIVTAEGDEYFTSGTDVRELDPQSVPSQSSARTLMRTILNFTKVLVGAVNGSAIGIGVTMLLHCDFVFAVPHATFRTPFMGLGIVPEFGSSVTFPALLGKAATNDLLLRGKTLDASRAVSVGLVTEVVPAAGFHSAVVGLTEQVTGQLHAKRSLLQFKAQIQRLGPLTKQQVVAAIEAEYEEIDRRFRSGEIVELGMAYLAQLNQLAFGLSIATRYNHSTMYSGTLGRVNALEFRDSSPTKLTPRGSPIKSVMQPCQVAPASSDAIQKAFEKMKEEVAQGGSTACAGFTEADLLACFNLTPSPTKQQQRFSATTPSVPNKEPDPAPKGVDEHALLLNALLSSLAKLNVNKSRNEQEEEQDDEPPYSPSSQQYHAAALITPPPSPVLSAKPSPIKRSPSSLGRIQENVNEDMESPRSCSEPTTDVTILPIHEVKRCLRGGSFASRIRVRRQPSLKELDAKRVNDVVEKLNRSSIVQLSTSPRRLSVVDPKTRSLSRVNSLDELQPPEAPTPLSRKPSLVTHSSSPRSLSRRSSSVSFASPPVIVVAEPPATLRKKKKKFQNHQARMSTLASHIKKLLLRSDKAKRTKVQLDASTRVSNMRLGSSPKKCKVKHEDLITFTRPNCRPRRWVPKAGEPLLERQQSYVSLDVMDNIGTRAACPVHLLSEKPNTDFSYVTHTLETGHDCCDDNIHMSDLSFKEKIGKSFSFLSVLSKKNKAQPHTFTDTYTDPVKVEPTRHIDSHPPYHHDPFESQAYHQQHQHQQDHHIPPQQQLHHQHHTPPPLPPMHPYMSSVHERTNVDDLLCTPTPENRFPTPTAAFPTPDARFPTPTPDIKYPSPFDFTRDRPTPVEKMEDLQQLQEALLPSPFDYLRNQQHQQQHLHNPYLNNPHTSPFYPASSQPHHHAYDPSTQQHGAFRSQKDKQVVDEINTLCRDLVTHGLQTKEAAAAAATSRRNEGPPAATLDVIKPEPAHQLHDYGVRTNYTTNSGYTSGGGRSYDSDSSSCDIKRDPTSTSNKQYRRKNCSMDGCNNLSRSKGLCKAHGGGRRCSVQGYLPSCSSSISMLTLKCVQVHTGEPKQQLRNGMCMTHSEGKYGNSYRGRLQRQAGDTMSDTDMMDE